MSPNCYAMGTCFQPEDFPCLAEAIQSSEETFFPVASAFNGLALYRTSAIGNCKYNGHPPLEQPQKAQTFGEDCEHVAFHNCMVRTGKKFMISSMQIEVERQPYVRIEHFG